MYGMAIKGNGEVSIPIGFSNELRRARPGYSGRYPVVSIPIGFSNELRLGSWFWWFRRIKVSIPIGFSNELRRQKPDDARNDESRFNPYRVFE